MINSNFLFKIPVAFKIWSKKFQSLLIMNIFFLERFFFLRKRNIKASFSLTSRFYQWNFLEWSFLIFIFCSSMNWVCKILNFHWQCSRSVCFSDMTNKKIKIFKFFWKYKLWEQPSKVVRSIERWDTDALKCEKMVKFFFVMI